jgi:hypothetical protein
MSILCSLCGRRKFFGLGWYKEKGINLCRRCWPNLPPTVDWFEERYATLQNCIGGSLKHKVKLFRLLGIEQSHVKVEDGKWLTERIIEHLSLPGGDIKFEFKKLETSIAGTVRSTGTGFLVDMSQVLQDNFRALSAILIHELMHIYLSNHGLFYKSQNEYEELTDLSCVLLGFGLPMINAKRAWHVERGVLGGGGVEKGTSYHIIGYLSEEQIGYAFAYFISHSDIPIEDVQSGIDSQCWHIILNGIAHEKSNRDKVIARRKSMQFLFKQSSKRDICEFSCPVCFLKMAVPRETLDRIGIFKVNCRRCGSEIHFDGKKIIKFIESLK